MKVASIILALGISVALVAAVVVLSGDGGEEELTARAETTTAEATETPQPSRTAALATATPAPVTATTVPPTATAPAPTVAAPTPLPDRTDCGAIQGTPYRSEAERQFYLANCLPTPTPVPTQSPNPTAAATTAPAEPIGTTVPAAALVIEGWWLLYDGTGLNAIKFDGQGNVVAFAPPVDGLLGQGQLSGNTLIFSARGFRTPQGEGYSVSYRGSRVQLSEVGDLGLPLELALAVSTGTPAFIGRYERTDLPGVAITVVAIKAESP